uniref:Uncharacterized protein n=1 Tax=Chrysotila carterae TaxID=13221 RepID=A0A7S4B496_CHRCT
MLASALPQNPCAQLREMCRLCWSGAHEQHSPAAYSRAQYQHEGNYPSMMQGDGEQQTWRHMQMHDHNGKLQDPTLENRQTTVGAPPLRFSSVASRQQNPQASLYTTSAQRLGPPSLGGSPPPPLYSGAYADMAKMSTKFTRQFAPPQPGTAFLNM